MQPPITPPTSLTGHGLLLPASVLHSGWFAVLATFVALNTVMYCALALGKMLPKVYVTDWLHTRNRRAQTRSIYPDGFTPTEPVDDRPLHPVG
jgi:hypothetical protein